MYNDSSLLGLPNFLGFLYEKKIFFSSSCFFFYLFNDVDDYKLQADFMCTLKQTDDLPIFPSNGRMDEQLVVLLLLNRTPQGCTRYI